MFALYALLPLGMLVLAGALWRAYALPWWQGVLIGFGALAPMAADEGPVAAAATLPLHLGMLSAGESITTALSRTVR